MSIKPPGLWTEGEDKTLRKCVKAGMEPSATADRLNRLEKSVVIRARVIGMPFRS